MSSYYISVNDASGESSKASLRLPTLTAANFDATVALSTAFRTAVDAVTRGWAYRDTIGITNNLGANIASTDPNAHRELKWLVTMNDSVTFQSLSMEIPTADSTLTLGASDNADMTHADIVALVDAIQAGHRSMAGNTVVVTNIKLVGRNL